MRASVILDGVLNFPDGEELTAKRIIEFIVEALDITDDANIPEFTINSAGLIKGNKLWRALHSGAKNLNEKIELALSNTKYKSEMYETFDAVGAAFDVTRGRDNIFSCWYQVSRFFFLLQKKCSQDIFTLVSARISSALLNKFLDVPDFDQNQTIMDSMEICWECGSVLSVALAAQKMTVIQTCLKTAYLDCVREFFALIERNPLFLSATFWPNTRIILEKPVLHLNPTSFQKYLEAISFTLGLRGSESEKMVELCNGSDATKFLVKALDITPNRHNSEQKQLILKLLKTMLDCSRKPNIGFDCDWTQVFACTLYSDDAAIRRESLELFLLEVQRTEKNEAANPYTRLEKAIIAYHRYDDIMNECESTTLPLGHANMKKFTDQLQYHENFSTCDKLFHLLRQNVSDRPAMCIVIVQIIAHALEELAKEPLFHDRQVNLTKQVLSHIRYVQPYPHLLHRLINVVDLSKVKNAEMFSEQILSLRATVLEAFTRCHQLSTAVELLEILKKIDFDDKYILMEKLMEKLISTDNQMRMPLILFLAADETFGILKSFHPTDRSRLVDYFKQLFEYAADVETKALYFAFGVNMLIAFNSAPATFPMESEGILSAAFEFYSGGFDDIIDFNYAMNPFASMILGNAVCVYYNSFNMKPDAAPLHSALRNLAIASFKYRHSFEADANQEVTKDFRLIAKYYRSATTLYLTQMRDTNEESEAIPVLLFEYYLNASTPLITLVEEFIVAVLKYGGVSQNYDVFAKTVRWGVKSWVCNNVKPLVKKLFDLIRKTDLANDASSVAIRIFLANLESICEKSDRPKTIWAVQAYLYKVHMATDSRELVVAALKRKIDSCANADRKCLEEFSQYLQHEFADKERNRRRMLRNDDEEEDHDDAESRPSPPNRRRGSGSNSSERRSNSLVSVNQSII